LRQIYRNAGVKLKLYELCYAGLEVFEPASEKAAVERGELRFVDGTELTSGDGAASRRPAFAVAPAPCGRLPLSAYETI